MSFAIFHSHLNHAEKILKSYDGSVPFAIFLKDFFSQHKKFGSRDRKQIAKLCYAFFRLGKSFPELEGKERILVGLKNINEPVETNWLEIFKEYDLSENRPENIFPWKDELSETVDAAAFEASILTQPDLFLRIRPGHKESVFQKLKKSTLDFSIEENTVRLGNSAKANEVLLLNKEVVVQDLSSQKISLFFEELKQYFHDKKTISVYDCCAASGGKSILAKDILQNIELTVSDIRPSIIANLRKRFLQAGISNYQSFVADISNAELQELNERFDLVIADVPCTGSGTWSRAPEQLYFFDNEKIERYASLQKNIVDNAMKAVKPGSFLLYITCSVFKKENEGRVHHLLQNNFNLIKQEVIKGYQTKADTMFAALFKKQ